MVYPSPQPPCLGFVQVGTPDRTHRTEERTRATGSAPRQPGSDTSFFGSGLLLHLKTPVGRRLTNRTPRWSFQRTEQGPREVSVWVTAEGATDTGPHGDRSGRASTTTTKTDAVVTGGKRSREKGSHRDLRPQTLHTPRNVAGRETGPEGQGGERDGLGTGFPSSVGG